MTGNKQNPKKCPNREFIVKKLEEIALPDLALSFLNQIMPSPEAYLNRASLYPKTYGNDDWCEQRVQEITANLKKKIRPRGQRAFMLFLLLGIGEGYSPGVNSIDLILKLFKHAVQRHRAASACLAVASNLMCGAYSFMNDWDVLSKELIIPNRRFSKLTIEKDRRIALIFRITNEQLFISNSSYARQNVGSQELKEEILDLETLRLEVIELLTQKGNMGFSSLLGSDASPLNEIEVLLSRYEDLIQNI